MMNDKNLKHVGTLSALAAALMLGGCMSFIPASCGIWFPLRRLQGWQQATRFSHVEAPPRDRGTTWSSVSSPEANTSPQN